MASKAEFITNELNILAWGASVQHVRIYRLGVNSQSKEMITFRKKVVDFDTDVLLPTYKDSGDREERHYKNIGQLIERASTLGDSVLGDDGYKYGVAQKLLNLMLKYHWCRG